MTRQMAFSLVEMLVVIAIISVLAAILLPTLEQSLELSRRIQCMNNERQQYAGAMQCALDSNNVLPWHRGRDDGMYTINNKCIYRGWPDVTMAYNAQGTYISPYYADTGLNTFITRQYIAAQMYVCPSQRYVARFDKNPNSGHAGIHYAYRYNSYRTLWTEIYQILPAVPGASPAYASPESWRLFDRRMKLALVTPAWQRMVLFSDYGAANNGCWGYVAGAWAHSVGGNAALHDGAVRWIPGPEPVESPYGGMSYANFDPMVAAVR